VGAQLKLTTLVGEAASGTGIFSVRRNRTEIKALESELSRRENPPMKRRRV